jgi:hypothetical protein
LQRPNDNNNLTMLSSYFSFFTLVPKIERCNNNHQHACLRVKRREIDYSRVGGWPPYGCIMRLKKRFSSLIINIYTFTGATNKCEMERRDGEKLRCQSAALRLFHPISFFSCGTPAVLFFDESITRLYADGA